MNVILENNLLEKEGENFYEKKSLTLGREDGSQLLNPSSLTYLEGEDLSPIYKIFTNIIGSNLGANVILECGEFQSVWREEMEFVKGTNTPNLEKVYIKMNELVSSPTISRRLNNLRGLNIKNFVEKNVARSFMDQLDKSIFYGDGERQPLGIISYFLKKKEGALQSINISKDALVESLLSMEDKMPSIYKKNSFWIMSRTFHNYIRKVFLTNHKDYGGLINRDNINYRLFNRKLYIFDELDEKKSKVHCLLINPVAYTTIEDDQIKIIENNMEIDLKLIFIKYFGGTVTNGKAVVYGLFSEN